MKIAPSMAAIFFLMPVPAFSGTWSGSLVDAGCYDAVMRNVNPTDTETYVDRDTSSDIRYCSPRAKTKSFEIVESDGTILHLDAAGNSKAEELVRGLRKRTHVIVTATGQRTGAIVQVDGLGVNSTQPAK